MTYAECRKMREEMKKLIRAERTAVLKNGDESQLLGDEALASALQERGYEARVYSMSHHRKLIVMSCVVDRWKQYQQERKQKDGKEEIQSTQRCGKNKPRA